MTVDPAELAPPLATKVIESPPPAASASLLWSLRPVVSGVVVGALGALLAAILLALVQAATAALATTRFESGAPLLIVLSPIVGGVLVGIGRRWWANGYDQLLSGRPPTLPRAVGQFGLAAATILFGGVAGREEPVVSLVAGLIRRGGLLARQRAVSLRGMAGSAVAGALSAAFGAPFAGLVFAFETVTARPAAGDLIALVVAAGLGAVVGRLLGVSAVLPSGAIPTEPAGWIAVIAIAVAALIVGLAITSLVGLVLSSLRRAGAPLLVLPAMGGAVVGLLTLMSPAFAGTDPVAPALLAAGADPLWLVTAAGRAATLVATLGFGGIGGVIGPTLGIGEALGAGLAGLLLPIVPGSDPATLAVVGGVVLLATVVRAPFASAVLAFEFGGDPALVIVLGGLAWGAAELSRRAEPWSIYRVLDTDEEPPRESEGGRLLATTLVRDVMTTPPSTLSATTTIGEAAQIVRSTGEETPIVDDRGMVIGLIGPHEIEVALLTTGPEAQALPWARHEFPIIAPYQTIARALEEPGSDGVAAIPVVDPRDPTRLVGLLRRARILEQLGLGPSAREEDWPRPPATERLPLLEIAIHDGSPWAGKRLRELRLPRDAYLAFLQRGDQRLPARGDSLLRVGDVLVGFAPDAVGSALRAEAAPAK